MKKKFVFAVVAIIVSVTILLYNSKNEVIFNSRTYTIEDGEYGIMLFDEFNAGDYSVKEYYSNTMTKILSLYDYQNRSIIWVELKSMELKEVNLDTIDLKSFNKKPVELLLATNLP
jgi:hypothetical protein